MSQFYRILVLVLALCTTAKVALAEVQPDETQALSKMERISEIMQENRRNNPISSDNSIESENVQSTEESSVMKMVRGLGLCIGLLLIGSAAVKRFQGTKGIAPRNSQMRIIERTALTSKTSLVLAEVDGERILLAVGADNVSSIALKGKEQTAKRFESEVETACKEEIRLSA